MKCTYIPLNAIQTRENVIELPKNRRQAFRTTKDLSFSDGNFPRGTEVEIIGNIFSCNNISPDEKAGLARQLKKDSDLMIVKLGGKFRALKHSSIARVS